MHARTHTHDADYSSNNPSVVFVVVGERKKKNDVIPLSFSWEVCLFTVKSYANKYLVAWDDEFSLDRHSLAHRSTHAQVHNPLLMKNFNSFLKTMSHREMLQLIGEARLLDNWSVARDWGDRKNLCWGNFRFGQSDIRHDLRVPKTGSHWNGDENGTRHSRESCFYLATRRL